MQASAEGHALSYFTTSKRLLVAWTVVGLITVHWSLCSRAHTKTSLQWGRSATCRGHDVHASLSLIYRYRPRTNKNEFEVPRGHCLYIQSTVLGQERSLEEPLLLPSRCRKFVFYKEFNFSVDEKEWISLMRLVQNSNSDSLLFRVHYYSCHNRLLNPAIITMRRPVFVLILNTVSYFLVLNIIHINNYCMLQMYYT
jgi:hypothetical protein